MSSLRTYDILPAGVVRLRPSSMATDCWLVECSHSLAQRAERTVQPIPPSGRTFCSVCKGDEQTTADYAKPVKLLVVCAETSNQASLF